MRRIFAQTQVSVTACPALPPQGPPPSPTPRTPHTQHELGSPTATVVVVEAWTAPSDPDAGRVEDSAAAAPSMSSAPPSPTVVGLAIWWTVADEVQVLELAVHPVSRRRGAGAALAAAAVGAAPPGGCALLEVAATNTAAAATYRTAGFKRVGVRRAYYKDGSDAVLMRADAAGAAAPGGGKGRGELPVQ